MNEELRGLQDDLQTTIKLMRDNADTMRQQDTRLQDVESLLKETDDRLQAAINEQSDMLKEAWTKFGRSPNGSPADGAPQDSQEQKYDAAFRRYVAKGEAALTDEQKSALQTKALSVDSDPDGGYFVTPAMSNRISTVIYETSPVRQVATTETITNADSLEGFYDGDEAAASWVGETGSRAVTNTPEIGMWSIPTHEIYANPQATQKVLEDASRNLEEWLSMKVRDKFARTENLAFVLGTGVAQPRGFMTYAAGTTRGTIQQVNTGAAATFTADGILTLIYTLKSAYRANAVHAMNRASVGVVRKLRDDSGSAAGTGGYFWQPGLAAGEPDTLAGYPVIEMEDIADVGSNALAAAFGDFRSAYTIVDRAGVRVLRDPYSNKPFIQLYTTKRVGGDVINFEAIKIAKCAT